MSLYGLEGYIYQDLELNPIGFQIFDVNRIYFLLYYDDQFYFEYPSDGTLVKCFYIVNKETFLV